MKTLKKYTGILSIGAVMMLAPFSSALAEEWRFAIEEIPGSIMDAYAQEFKKRIESATNNEVTVTVYPMGSLGTPTETVEQAADGVIHFTNVSIGNLGTIVPESQVFLLTYVLPSDAQAISNILTSSNFIYQDLAQDFRSKGLELLTMYSEGPQVWTTNREIRTPEDFANFKMRVMVSPILLKAYEDLGASPTPLPFGEVYGALQLKAVDGQVNPAATIEEMKFYEVTDYLIWAGEQELVTSVLAGSDWFETLSPERQKLVRDTMAGMVDFIDEVVVRFNQEKLERIKQAKPDIKIVVLTEDERNAFRARSVHTHQAYLDIAGNRGRQLLDALMAEVAKY
ncbi:MAG: TRAP transporter substrate-binding protein DctP [Pseudomonadota bacterium]